jgi:hypothetical protein
MNDKHIIFKTMALFFLCMTALYSCSIDKILERIEGNIEAMTKTGNNK